MNGQSKDVQMDANGVVIEVEEQVSMEALSAEVKAGCKREGDKTARRFGPFFCVIKCF